jgi:hypothetical protein
MKANELRIGNKIIFSEDGTIFTVGSIEEKGFMVQNEEETTWIESEEFEPIPLTEEWLLKFGFEKINNDVFRIIQNDNFKSPFSIAFDNINNLFKIAFQGYWYHCKHVHQLQNLYFALTGEELICDNGQMKK